MEIPIQHRCGQVRHGGPRISSPIARLRYIRRRKHRRRACVRNEVKSRRTCTLVKREDIWQRQHMVLLGNDSLAIRALAMSKDTVAGLVGAPRWCGDDDAGKLGTEHEWARRLRLVLSLGLQYLSHMRGVCQGKRRSEARGETLRRRS